VKVTVPFLSPFDRDRASAVLATWGDLAPAERRRIMARLPSWIRHAFDDLYWAHHAQREPAACASGAPWRVWAIVAGRGHGKTRAGAEWVWARARETPDARIALVAASREEVERVMIEGDSGLIACARRDEQPRWISSRGLFLFPSGARAFAYGAARPGTLRGPQHHFAWCDELAKWHPATRSGLGGAEAAWDNLMLGLRLGTRPRTIVTTTPLSVPLMKRIVALERCATTHGRTDQNGHSAADYRAAAAELYGGTRLGRQELDGLLFDDPEGALWTRAMLDEGRVGTVAFPRGGDLSGDGLGKSNCPLVRVVIGVDPPASAGGDACGIVVCGADGEGAALVLADLSVAGLRPEGWARRVAAAAREWDAQTVIAEKNQGGDMIESVLRGVDMSLPVRLAGATRSKAARAEPVALRFETGRARLAGHFPALEDELCAFTHAGYQGAGSPDRADAMIWAMSELIRPERTPRVRRL
jgi:phage terminase large subunit-like protein